ncbi:MAG: ribonuclease R [Alphaproteobacteria bacterium]|nr:ribonuclease R [Alphaproteobacteria bacterium]
MRTALRHRTFGKTDKKRGGSPPSSTGKKQKNADFQQDRRRPENVVGQVRRQGRRWILEPADRRERSVYLLHVEKGSDLKDGDLIVAENLGALTTTRTPEARFKKKLGAVDQPGAFSLIALEAHGIPYLFSDQGLAEATAAQPVSSAGRTDLRDLELVTIDGEDARDFDDAVFAEKEGNGWHIVVAIADVAHYVRPQSALDRDAFHRGNSTYFPDRVVPMLPQELSNDLCSLKPGQDRACLAVHLHIDKKGTLESFRFVRALMRSKARLTYRQVQAARDGFADETTAGLMATVIDPLYGAFTCLRTARAKRGTLDLSIPERVVELNNGVVQGLHLREQLDSHRLVEEFMILANVAAAQCLETHKSPLLYRVHDQPAPEKLDDLRRALKPFGIALATQQPMHPRALVEILKTVAGMPYESLINELILRSQAQAVYHPENIGHFGLALPCYAHFTSPIRRYADLIVHRALIQACGFGNDGLTQKEIRDLEETAEHISMTERRSATAERDADNRFTAQYMVSHIGSTLDATISGLTRTRVFARLTETGAEGAFLLHKLKGDRYIYDERKKAVIGKRTHKTYRIGAPLTVRITQVDVLTGSIALVPEGPAREPGQRTRPETPDRSRHNQKKSREDKRLRSLKILEATPKCYTLGE